MKKELKETLVVKASEFTRVPLKESEGGKFSAHWQSPVWKLDTLNLNGRVYGTDLANRVVEENAVTGVCDGHEPSMCQEFQNYVGVAKDPFIKDGFLWVDIYLVDEAYAGRIERLHDLGLPIGVSSVGYGDVDADGVVDPKTYTLVRYMDFVTYPAGRVYAEPQQEGKGAPTGGPGTGEASEVSAKAEAYIRLNDFLKEKKR